MFVHNSKVFGLDALTVWWPKSVADVRAFLNRNRIVVLWQCPMRFIAEIRPYLFYRRSFSTPLVDLSLAEDQLWQRLDPKSCRYEIRKAQKLNATTLQNEDMESARTLINEGIRRLRYRAEIGPEEWRTLLPGHDVFVCKWEKVPVVAHVILADAPGRARLLLSGTVDRHDLRYRNVIGPLNRLLHWNEILHYKSRGFRHYDFGGCDVDEHSQTYPITQFKLSFGAEVVEEPILYLAKGSALRVSLRTLISIREGLKKLPWADSLRKVVRGHGRMSAFFRYPVRCIR